jgi:hypothetical protein
MKRSGLASLKPFRKNLALLLTSRQVCFCNKERITGLRITL